MASKMIGDGAEAKVYLSPDKKTIVKERVAKGYRIPDIDISLRRQRTRKEAKLLSKLYDSGFTPRVSKSDDKTMTIHMENIRGEKVRDCLDKRNLNKICPAIGMRVAELHNIGIIHSDLTTSNMIIVNNPDDDSGAGRLFLIDFGLSFESHQAEDKAVDLHLLRQALESKHHDLWEKAFQEIMKSYRTHAKNSEAIIQRLQKVESRGRNKSKGS